MIGELRNIFKEYLYLMHPKYDKGSGKNPFPSGKYNFTFLILFDDLKRQTYRVSHIETSESKWFWAGRRINNFADFSLKACSGAVDIWLLTLIFYKSAIYFRTFQCETPCMWQLLTTAVLPRNTEWVPNNCCNNKTTEDTRAQIWLINNWENGVEIHLRWSWNIQFNCILVVDTDTWVEKLII